MSLNSVVERVTNRVIERSKVSRRRYLDLMERNRQKGISRPLLSCSNMAHAVAAEPIDIKDELIEPTLRMLETSKKKMSLAEREKFAQPTHANIGIITSYNDMISAHQPYEHYPERIRLFAREVNATAQVASGTPGMCDGVTQGQEGMDLSLYSRDVIAQSTAIGLSHGMYEAVALLGICDKIVPGLLMGALRFGHLPTMLIPAGPMTTGQSNDQKAKVRKLFIEGKVTAEELMHSELKSYHSSGTCTFYGTANTNQLVAEFLGLTMPDSAFAVTETPLRQGLTRSAIHNLVKIGLQSEKPRPMTEIVTEKSVVNAIVGLMATGGSTNLTIHLPAIARAAGIIINWQDYSDLSSVVPDLAKVYPSSDADINAFNEAGGIPYVIKELMEGGYLNTDVKSVYSDNLEDYTKRSQLDGKDIKYVPVGESKNPESLRSLKNPFSQTGGLKVLTGNLGRGVSKVSAVTENNLVVEAPAIVFQDQSDVKVAQQEGKLDQDTVVVVQHQGPRANGMPELHKLIAVLGVQMDKGYHMALVTDGRLSGASGSVPSAVHVGPEAQRGGPIGKVKDGDVIRLDGRTGKLEVVSMVDTDNKLIPFDEAKFDARVPSPQAKPGVGTGRELFAIMRRSAPGAEEGASAMQALMDEDLEIIGDDFSGERV